MQTGPVTTERLGGVLRRPFPAVLGRRVPVVPRSLRARLTLLAVLVTAGFLLLLTVAFNVVLGRQLAGGADDLLRTRAEAAAATVDVAADGTLRLREPVDGRSLEAGTWVYQGGTVLEGPSTDATAPRRVDELVDRGEVWVKVGPPDAQRLYALPLRDSTRQVGTVVTRVDLDPYDRVADIALVGSVALAGLVLVGSYLLNRVIIGRALDPVARMTRQAAQWSASDLERRFGAEARPTELTELAGTLDGLLERLAAVLRHERQLSAELSHELRTPLAALVAELDLLRSRPRGPQELAAGHDAIAASAERMGQVLESLLTAARATSTGLPGRCAVLPAVRAAIGSLAPPDGVVQVFDRAPGAVAGVDAALLERSLAPVLANALRFARQHVSVEVDLTRSGSQVVVRDDGPGVPPELADRVFEPGVRGNDSDHPGSGLGLALARRLARAGGGDLTLSPAPGGARFVLSLPA